MHGEVSEEKSNGEAVRRRCTNPSTQGPVPAQSTPAVTYQSDRRFPVVNVKKKK